MTKTPKDTDGTQLAGRLLAYEAILTRMILERSDAADFVDRVSADLDRYERGIRGKVPEDEAYITGMAEAARMTIDEIRFQLARSRRQIPRK